MSFKKKQQHTQTPTETFTRDDFLQAEKEIKTLHQSDLPYKETEINWLIKKGAAKRGWHGELVVLNPSLFASAENLLSDYYRWKGRKEFSEKKQLEGYSQIAEQMSEEKNQLAELMQSSYFQQGISYMDSISGKLYF